MKPILVNNQSEWLRLAPVLEALGYFWRGGSTPTEFCPFNSTQFWVYFDSEKFLYFDPVFMDDAQSVDEYLTYCQHSKNIKPSNSGELKTDYQALYEAEKAKNEKLTQGVKGAKAEIVLSHSDCYINSPNPLESQAAYQHALEILTEKTGI